MTITITKIERQKKHAKRCSLFAGDEFIAGISEDTLLAFNLHAGKSISEDDLQQILENEKRVAVREHAWRFLSRREHSSKELRDKLCLRNHDRDLVDQVIADLVDKKYLDDDRYARQIILDHINLKYSGPLLIKSKLLQKGIPMPHIEDLLTALYPEAKRLANCRHLAAKKLGSLQRLDNATKRNRLATYLAQKGYTWEISGPVITGLIKGDEDEIE
ncbi:MAG: hypothetical protein E4H13_06590 [Calditrichales bacterium]|nr:MAG: hypothetical protein E4H13_06590 [Calditrichales bacterium]